MFWGQTTLHKKKSLQHGSWAHWFTCRGQIWWKLAVAKLTKWCLLYLRKKPLLRHRIVWTTLAPYEADHAHNSWTFLPLTSARIPNLVQSGWSLLDLFPKDFTLQTRKVIGRYGFQPTTTLRLVYENSSLSSWPINAFNANQPVA